MYRHSKNKGRLGTSKARFGCGDSIHRTTPIGTSRSTVRGIEHIGTRDDGVLGRASSSVRGNIDQGISDKNLNSTNPATKLKYESMVSDANKHLSSQGAKSARNLKSIKSEKFKSTGCP